MHIYLERRRHKVNSNNIKQIGALWAYHIVLVLCELYEDDEVGEGGGEEGGDQPPVHREELPGGHLGGDCQLFQLHKLRFKIKWKYGGQINETWHIHTEGHFRTNFSFLNFSSKFQLPHLTNIHTQLLYWFLEWHCK